MKLSRRQILRGAAGATLALPLLPSLLEREALAKSPLRPPRLLWFTTEHGGAYEAAMFPGAPLTQTASAPHPVGAGPLVTTVQGANRRVSPILSAPSVDLTPGLVGKMNVLRGIDISFELAHHSGGHLGNFARNDGNTPSAKAVQASPRPTIDQIMAYSPAFYPNLATVRERTMLAGRQVVSYNWTDPVTRTGKITGQVAGLRSKDLFNKIFVAPSTGSSRRPVVDQVLADYKSLRNGNRRLSSEDKQRLDDYVAQLAELQRKLDVTGSCTKVTVPTDEANAHRALTAADAKAWANLFVDVMVAAFACGTSRIGIVAMENYNGLGSSSAQWHSEVAHHWNTDGQPTLVEAYRTFFAGVMVRAAAKLDAIGNGFGGTLLDDTLVVWSQECCVSTHSQFSLPIVTFGSAAGALKTGLSCDYRWRNNPGSNVAIANGESTSLGLPYQRWLATVLQAMGVPRSGFELWGHKGYGVPFVSSKFANHYTDTSSTYFQQASDPLPFLWA